MTTRTELSLADARVQAVAQDGDCLRVCFEEYFLYIALSGSDQQTKWRQSGSLVLEQARIVAGAPGAGLLAGGDVQDNACTYRDRVPLPLDSRGQVGCVLRFHGRDEPLRIQAARIRLQPTDERRYVAHVT